MNILKRTIVGSMALVAMGSIAHANSVKTWPGKEFGLPRIEAKNRIGFCMYTVHNKTMKMMVQMYPLADSESRLVQLEIRRDGKWENIAKENIRENEYGSPKGAKAWNLLFRVENWDDSHDFQYRIVALDGVATYCEGG